MCDCRWILATYDVDVFDSETYRIVNASTAPLNKGMDIPEFDYSRKEVEVATIYCICLSAFVVPHTYSSGVNKSSPRMLMTPTLLVRSTIIWRALKVSCYQEES